MDPRRRYVRRQSGMHCQQAPKHIINPVVTWEGLQKLLQGAAREGEAHRQRWLFPSSLSYLGAALPPRAQRGAAEPC